MAGGPRCLWRWLAAAVGGGVRWCAGGVLGFLRGAWLRLRGGQQLPLRWCVRWCAWCFHRAAIVQRCVALRQQRSEGINTAGELCKKNDDDDDAAAAADDDDDDDDDECCY